ncbi:MAG: anhydro-N-acetylmuramic acid kinase [Bacteroidota bacterium]
MAIKTYKVLGLMSGSSLDGLDLACCQFEVEKTDSHTLQVHDWSILTAETIGFSESWQARLSQLPTQNALNFAKTHTYLGHYWGDMVNDFLQRHQIEPDFIAAHGHTIFHDPIGRMTIQIGDGSAMAAVTGYPVITNFRHQDIAIDGQGAPIAPIVDKYLLAGHDFYLNLGGIANITTVLPNKIIAFDICPANQLLNALAHRLNLPYDEGGQIAASGAVNDTLLKTINRADFYRISYPKSLDNAWSRTAILSQLADDPAEIPNQLATFVEHIAYQIAFAIKQVIRKEKVEKKQLSLLATGGGAFNTFLVERLQHYGQQVGDIKVVIPDSDIIQFKEAALMAWMGVMRVEHVPNVLKSVTGAKRDTVNGAIHQGWRKQI